MQRPLALAGCAALLGLLSLPSSAVLPPRYENAKKLGVMVQFVREHPQVMAQLRSIDLDSDQVRYGNDCIAEFGHTAASQSPGPLPPLVFLRSNCSVGVREVATPQPSPDRN